MGPINGFVDGFRAGVDVIGGDHGYGMKLVCVIMGVLMVGELRACLAGVKRGKVVK